MRISPELTGGLLIAWTIVYVAGLLVLEWLTLRDTIPGNHITAVIRSAWEKQSWAFLPFIAAIAYLGGHFFASDKGTPDEPKKLVDITAIVRYSEIEEGSKTPSDTL